MGSALDRFNEQKKKKESASKTTSGGSAYDRFKAQRESREMPQTIDKFIKDANTYFEWTSKDYGNFGYENREGVKTNIDYQSNDLKTRGDNIRKWLVDNKSSLDSKAYDSILSVLDQVSKGVGDISGAYLDKYNYMQGFDSAEEYNKLPYNPQVQKAAQEYLQNGLRDGSFYKSQQGAEGWNKYLADNKANMEAAKAAQKKKSFWEKAGDVILEAAQMSAQSGDSNIPMQGMLNAQIDAYRNDVSYMRPQDDWSKVQQYEFGRLYLESPAKAYAYAEETNKKNAQAKEEAARKEIQDNATSEFWAGAGNTIGAIATAPLGMVDFLDDIAKISAGREITPDGNISPFEYSQAVTEGISTHLNEKGGVINENVPIIGGKGWGDVYGLGTSIAQSLASAYTLGPYGTLVSYFGQGAASGVDDALRRGASEEQALLYGTALGVFEGVFEMLGVEHLFRLGSTSGIIKNILKQSGAEGMEEGLTSLFSNIADNVIMQGKSNFNALVEQYMAQGMSKSEAQRKAWMDSVGGIAFDTIAGAISGGVSGGVHTGFNAIGNNAAIKEHGQSILDNGGQDALMQLAREVDADKKLTRLTDKAEAKPTASRIGKLSAYMEQSNAKANRDTFQRAFEQQGLSKKDAERATAYVMDELSPEESAKLENNKTVMEAVDAVIENPNLNIGADTIKLASARQPQKPSETVNATNKEIATEGKFEASEDGKTRIGDTEVSVKEIASVKDGVVTLRLEDGSTVNASDVTFGSDEALLYENVVHMGFNAATANAFINNYEGNMPVAEYALDFRQAYRYGELGIPKKEIYSEELSSKLSDSQKSLAYDLGRTDAKYKASENESLKAKIASADTIKSEKIASKDKKKGKLHNTLKPTNETQRASLKALGVLAEALNIDIYTFESPLVNGRRQGENGSYDPVTKSLRIDLYAGVDGKGVMLYTAAHELTHDIREKLPAKFKAFADFLFEQYGEKGISVSELIARKKAFLEEKGRITPDMTEAEAYDLAYEEVVADSCESFLADGEAVAKIAELKAKDKTLWQTIKDFITKLVARIKAAYEGLSPDSVEGRRVAEMLDSAEKLKAMWTEMVVEASEVADDFVKEHKDKVKYSDRDSLGNELSKAQQEFFKDSKVRDKKGNLLVLYHGTTANFNTFKKGDVGFHFGTKGAARGRVGFGKNVTIKEVYLNITNPIVFDEDLGSWDADYRLTRELYDMGILTQAEAESVLFTDDKRFKRTTEASNKKLAFVLLEKGYDGIAYSNTFETKKPTTSYIVFNSNQAKEVTNSTPTSNPDVRYSERGYGAIREAIAKNGLDELSVKLGNYFPLSASFDATMRADNTTLTMTTVKKGGVLTKKGESAFTAGKNAFRAAYGTKTNVHINQMDIDAVLYTDVAKESIVKAENKTDLQTILDVIPHVKEILGNSVLASVERINHTNNKTTALYGYRLYNLYWYEENNKKTPHCLVCTVVQNTQQAEGYVFRDIENVTIDHGLPGENTDMPEPVNDDIYTVAQLYGFVKGVKRENGGIKYSPEDKATYLFHYKTRNDGVMYSDRPTDSVSNRSLLANALESITENEIEKNKLAEYKAKIEKMNAETEKLAQLKAEIKELTFGKGEKNPEKLKNLRSEATKTENRINTYDKQLLNLEATTALKRVLEREKQKAYKRAAEKGREALRRNVEGRNKTAMRHKIQDVARRLDKLLNRGTKERNVKTEMTGFVRTALEMTDMLFATDDELIMNGIVSEARENEKQAIARFEALYEEYHSYDDSVTENKERRAELRSEMNEVRKELSELLNAERARINNAKASDIFDKLVKEIKNFSKSQNEYISHAFDNDKMEFIEDLASKVGNTLVKDMTLDQLETVYKALRVVETTVQNSNKLFGHKDDETVDKLGAAAVREIKAHGEKKLITEFGKGLSNMIGWNNLKPIYLAERLGSTTLQRLMSDVLKAESDWATYVAEAEKYVAETKKKHGYDKWDFKKKWEFSTGTGLTYELDLGLMMTLYAYAKRGESATNHLRNDGFAFDKLKVKKGVITYELNDSTAYKVTDAVMLEIGKILTDKQKAFVDDMQKYLSDTLGARGNEISNQLVGISLFNEENYLPIRSEGAYLERKRLKDEGSAKMKNRGFTNPTQENARNAIILSDFLTLCTEHIVEMNEYAAFTLPLENFYKVYNWQNKSGENTNKVGVIPALENAYGKGTAVKAVDELLKDLNGGAKGDYREGVANKAIAAFKKAKVMFSFSVVIQQPSSILRAQAMIDPKYFVGKKYNKDGHKAQWEELKKYAPVAVIKEMGYFDIGMGQTAAQWISGEKTLRDRVDEITSWGAAKADEVTWIAIWNAVKRETLHNNPKMNPRSEAFLQLAGARFEDIIRHTQVYDSTLARSANMRSKSTYMKMLTSFMAEPTTSLNMREMALRSKNKGRIARTTAAVYASFLLNAFLVAIPYAMRDDDEDETWWEKYFSALESSFVDNINPINSLPIFKDIWSLSVGYDVERSDMSLASDLMDSFMGITKAAYNKDKDKLASSIFDGVGDLANLTGSPLKNLVREVEAIVNFAKTIDKDINDRDMSWNSFSDEIVETLKNEIPVWGWLPDKKKTDKIYESIMEGDEKYLDRLESSFKDHDSYVSAVRKALRENDSRIHDAAIADIEGDVDEYDRIVEDILGDGKFTEEDIKSAINSEINFLTDEEDTESEPKKKSIYEPRHFYSAVNNGNTSLADKIREDIVATHEANGKSREKAEEAFESSFKGYLSDLYKEDSISSTEAAEMLVDYCGRDEDEAYWDIRRWDYVKANNTDEGYSMYNEFNEAVRTGKNLKAVIKEYTSHGKDNKTLGDQITSYYKPLYKEMTNRERANIKGYLLNAYVLLGYDRSKKSKDIDKWLEK